MTPDELKQYAQEQGERFWKDAGQHWLNDGFDLQSNSLVVEIGGYLGDWTDYVQRKYDCFVDVYEPVEEFALHMKRRFSNRSKIQVFNEAVLSDQGKQAHIAVMGEGSSFYNGGVSQGPLVRVVSADKIVMGKDVDLLAINAEGSEYLILDILSNTGTISRFKQVLVQFHTLFDDSYSRRTAIRSKLTATHNEKWAYPFCWELWVRK